ncbi:acyltransferase [Pseudomonas costantinii]|uniref:acyltransferase n=1 Tax=Pseudomonas costantinii TaxID=168469 RepID=UPI00210AD5BB|nr:acyltransferase [Pseudomonas costantinii]
MAYLSSEQLAQMGFKALGQEVRIGDRASIYNADEIKIDKYSRIDDFCVITGKVKIGKFNHIIPMCLVTGGISGIIFEDFFTLTYGAKIFFQSDDRSGQTLTKSLISPKYKNEKLSAVHVHKHVIVGAAAVVFPSVVLAEGGGGGLVTKSTDAWCIDGWRACKKSQGQEERFTKARRGILRWA